MFLRSVFFYFYFFMFFAQTRAKTSYGLTGGMLNRHVRRHRRRFERGRAAYRKNRGFPTGDPRGARHRFRRTTAGFHRAEIPRARTLAAAENDIVLGGETLRNA